ncbi:hypothetical protein [Psychroflexus aestuariivivens]|uniref:hypothetical protein n=1 Tax=Psychroflexus aestuariivivens TaxID=1795040 RepID=UPI000FDBE73C|nr:hypothetical protein [Psychroflexus aestuariivivens]
MELLKNHQIDFQNSENANDIKLIDRDISLISRLTQIIKILQAVLMNKNLSGHFRFEIENAYQLAETIINDEKKVFKPTTIRLKNKINKALIENKHGDGVIVRILTKENYKIEKCSILNFNINEK